MQISELNEKILTVNDIADEFGTDTQDGGMSSHLISKRSVGNTTRRIRNRKISSYKTPSSVINVIMHKIKKIKFPNQKIYSPTRIFSNQIY